MRIGSLQCRSIIRRSIWRDLSNTCNITGNPSINTKDLVCAFTAWWIRCEEFQVNWGNCSKENAECVQESKELKVCSGNYWRKEIIAGYLGNYWEENLNFKCVLRTNEVIKIIGKGIWTVLRKLSKKWFSSVFEKLLKIKCVKEIILKKF